MKKPLSPERWLNRFFSFAISLLLLLVAIAYAVDPLFQFRINEKNALTDYPQSGLIRNYSYDTIIIGSSMVQNFDMNTFRDKLGVEPLHIGIGGMRMSEMTDLIKLAYKTRHVVNYYICVDLYLFSSNDSTRYTPKYLSRDDVLSRCRYLFSHEIWFHDLPLDLILMAADALGLSKPDIMTCTDENIDKLGYWGDQFSFGEEVVLDNYLSGKYAVSQVDLSDLYGRMTKRIDTFFQSLDFAAGKHVFFFPPYSALFWYDAQNFGYFNEYLQAKEYFVEQAEKYGASTYDFQSAALTVDLNNYKDTTHYSPAINEWMTECFANGDYLTSLENNRQFEGCLIDNTKRFRSEYSDLFSD